MSVFKKKEEARPAAGVTPETEEKSASQVAAEAEEVMKKYDLESNVHI